MPPKKGLDSFFIVYKLSNLLKMNMVVQGGACALMLAFDTQKYALDPIALDAQYVIKRSQ